MSDIEETYVHKLIDSIEKIYRYIIPGILFIFLFKLSFTTITPNESIISLTKNFSKLELYIYLPLIGMIIYSLHRLVFELIDIALCKFNSVEIAESIKKNHPNQEERLNYLYYKMGMMHFYFILSELLFIFSLERFHLKNSFIDKFNLSLFWISIILFFITFAYYIFMHKVQRKIIS